MVQLNTSYDSQLKGKIFVLKGEEAYAKTTDTVAELISDYDDCNSHMRYTRVGLQIKVLRAEGDGYVTIFVDGVPQDLVIPYNPQKMNQIIDEDYHDKGVWWIDGALVIGESDNADTGYFLSYDEEHSIVVEYSGNKKCLGSKSETILFEHERPDALVSSLSFGSTPTYVDSVYPTGVATITGTIELECDYEVEEEQRNVYLIIDDLGIRELVEVYPNTPTSFELTGVSEGLQSIRAVFDGDYEILDCTETLDVSVGCKVVVSSESYNPIINDESTYYKVSVSDYFGNPMSGTVSPVYCQSISESIDGNKQITLSKSEYSQMIGQNPNIDSNVIDMTTLFTKSETAKYLNVPIGSEDAFGVKYYDDVTVSFSYDEVICLSRTTPITATFTSNGNPVPNLRTNLTIDGSSGVIRTNQDGKATFNHTGFGKGAFEISTNRPVYSETVIDYDRYWSKNPNIMVNRDAYRTFGASLEQSNDSFLLKPTRATATSPSWIEFESDTRYSKYNIQFTITSLGGYTRRLLGLGKNEDSLIYIYVGSVITITKEYVPSEHKTYFTMTNGSDSTSLVEDGNTIIALSLVTNDTIGVNKLKGWIVG